MEEEKKNRLKVERAAIINRTMIYLTSMFILITLVTGFFLAPELYHAQQQRDRVAALEKNIQELEKQIAILNAAPEKTPTSAAVSHNIERIENFGENVASLGEKFAELEESFSGASENLGALVNHIDRLEASLEGQENLVMALEELKKIIAQQKAQLPPQEQGAQTPPEEGTQTDAVKGKDLKAAAMLLALGQMRKSLDRQAPIDSDLKLLREYANDDPELAAAIDNLAPYAQSGVLSPDGLKQEFKGLASDIVISELRGEDANWTEKAKARLENLVRIRREGDAEGEDTEAVVARAEFLLDKGDVDGAIAELQSLKGPAAETAAPWMQKAEGKTAADEVIDMATEKALQQLSGTPGATLEKIMEILGRPVGGVQTMPDPPTLQTPGTAQTPPGMILDMSPREIPGPSKLPTLNKNRKTPF